MNVSFLKCGSRCLKFSKVWTTVRKMTSSTMFYKNYMSSPNTHQCRNFGFFILLRNYTHSKLSFLSKLTRVRKEIRSLTSIKNRCWHCNAVVTERDLVCLTCGCIQEPRNNLNYFEVFKEKPQFDIDARYLSIKFRRLQSVLHPDKFASRSEKEQQYSMEQSSLVNKAYQTLRNPMERGLYLLELYGKPLLENDSAPADFLGDIMEINENLAVCNSIGDVEAIRHVNDAKLELLFGELSQAFKEKNIDRAKEILAKLKYYMSIDTQIRKKEDQMGIYRED